ncbi:hypothetical protein CUBB_gp229 [Staphylococcus phage CUB-B]|nr:hypothetical protein CUBB_gp229 [Staphylococcus phage CUB-B]
MTRLYFLWYNEVKTFFSIKKLLYKKFILKIAITSIISKLPPPHKSIHKLKIFLKIILDKH